MQCPECRNEISDKALSCPQCGAPKALADQQEGCGKGCLIAVIVIVVLVFIVIFGIDTDVDRFDAQDLQRAREKHYRGERLTREEAGWVDSFYKWKDDQDRYAD